MSVPSREEIVAEILEASERSSWWKGVIEECARVERVSQLPDFITDEHKAIIVQSIWEQSLITDDDLSQAADDPHFREARDIIAQLRQDDPFPERLTELFGARKSYAVNRIEQHFLKLLPFIVNEDCRNEVQARWYSNGPMPTFTSLIGKYPTNDPNQRYLLRSIIELSELRPTLLLKRSPFEFEQKYTPLKFGEGDNKTDRISFLAYRVYDPLWFDGMEQYEPSYIEFPLKWAGSLFSVSVMRQLYNEFKRGHDVITEIVRYFRESDALELLADAIKNCPLTRRHGELFSEIADSFRTGSFRICSRSLLSLLEGLIWDFAWWWNQKSDPILLASTTEADYARGEFKLINRSGQPINAKPTIGLLLRNTKFGDEFYFEFLEYFCQELFAERNPVLHGREPDYGDERKAASLLLVTRIVEKEITDAFTKMLMNEARSVKERTTTA
jgi:hypothetical protein